MSEPEDASASASAANDAPGLLRLADRLPTKWFAGAAVVLFLLVTAAFGGLKAVPTPPVPNLGAGVEHRNQQFAIAVDAAYLRTPDGARPGERDFVAYVTAENLWTSPQGTLVSGLSSNLVLTRLPDVKASEAIRLDDRTVSAWLQPGVPARLALSWRIPSGTAIGPKVELTLLDLTPAQGSFVVSGEYWADPTPGAQLTLPVQDLGNGELP